MSLGGRSYLGLPVGSRQIDSRKRGNVHFFINLTFKGNFHMILTIRGVNLVFAALRLEGMHKFPLPQSTARDI